MKPLSNFFLAGTIAVVTVVSYFVATRHLTEMPRKSVWNSKITQHGELVDTHPSDLRHEDGDARNHVTFMTSSIRDNMGETTTAIPRVIIPKTRTSENITLRGRPMKAIGGDAVGKINRKGSPMLSKAKNKSKKMTVKTSTMTIFPNATANNVIHDSDHIYRYPCDRECMEFRIYMKSWPSSKPKGIIYYLIKMDKTHLKRLKLSLKIIDEFFNKKYHYPVVIFHDEDFIFSSRKEIRLISSARTFFQKVQLEIPDFIKDPVPLKIPGCTRDVSYRHMCRFHAKLVYEQPIVDGVEYMWRMDDDSYILQPLRFDIFQYMKNNDILYGYQTIGSEIEACVVGLWEAVERYKKLMHLKPKLVWKYPRYYFNNFEISNRQLWISKDYQDYIEYVDHEGGFFYHRWGDAPVKSLGVSLFVPKEQTYCFHEKVSYQHSIYKLKPQFISRFNKE